MSKTFFAYHLTHFFGPFSLDSYYTNSSKPQEGDRVYVISGDENPDSTKGKDYSLEGVFTVHRKTRGPWALKALSGMNKQFEFRLSMAPIRVPDRPIPLDIASWYNRLEVRNYFASGQNFNPIPTDPDYKTRFDNLLSGFGQIDALELAEDLAELEKTPLGSTERETLVKARIGQGQFRSDITSLWRLGEKCPLTNIEIPELLIASHIKPWRDSDDQERLDPHNGLLLATHVDKLFDRYLLSFRYESDEFRVEIHPRVRNAAKNLGVTQGTRLKTTHLTPSQTQKIACYLAEHYQRFLQRVSSDTPTCN